MARFKQLRRMFPYGPRTLKILGTLCGVSIVVPLTLGSGNHTFYSNVIMPLARKMDPEKAHGWAVFLARFYSIPGIRNAKPDPILKIDFCGIEVASPIGLAAGFDKDAVAFHGLGEMGFGFVEVGTVTPKPQPGNPKPRLFRLTEQNAIINRMGFNSCGLKYVESSLKNRNMKQVVGVNLGVNKNSNDALSDYKEGIVTLGPYASYLVINVSSPNTPGLRDLQRKELFGKLLYHVMNEKNKLKNKPPPLLVKIAPDLTDQELEDICQSVVSHAVDGVIVCNTTISRKGVEENELRDEPGGLSGAPLRERSTQLVKQVYRLTGGQVPIIASGGVFTEEDVLEKLRAGASAVQMYSGFVFQGPTVVAHLNRQLAARLKADGVTDLKKLVGADVNLMQRASTSKT